MAQENHPKYKQTYSSGANSDMEQELFGAQDNGQYRDSRNNRLTSVDGNLFASEKIKGHELEHDLTSVINPISSNYVCIGKHEVKGQNVSLWASPVAGDYASISVDGQIVCQSVNLPLTVNNPCQTDNNDSCIGGELFVTDDNVPPMIFNIKDMVDSFNAGSQKYFSEFNANAYTVNLSAPIDIPVFEELVDVGAGGGLPIGNYSYAIRYVSDEGDRTNRGPLTPQISVVRDLNDLSDQYPYSLTEGDLPDLNSNTKFGIKLRFRVNNELNYDFIEVIRYSWNGGTTEYFVPQPTIIGKIDIQNGEISIKEFTDPVESNTNEVITDEEDTVQQEFIEKAKGIRYYDKRLVLMNIETGSRDFEPDFETDSQDRYMYPCVQKLFKAGHADPYQNTYNKSYMGGESFGFSVQAYDGVAGKGFAVPIPNDTGDFGYIIPNRRTEITNGSEEDLVSYDGMVTAANVNGTVSKTLEVFDHEDAESKTDVCKLIGIANPGDIGDVTDDGKFKSTLNQYCSLPPSARGAIPSAIAPVTQWQSQYQPWTPVNNTDNDVIGHNVVPNTKVELGSGDGEEEYRPKGFGLDYYSRGMTLHGVDGFPSWVKSFSIGRTKRANRVVCQGIGCWSLIEREDKDLQLNNASKRVNKMTFFSPDIQAGFVSQSIIDGIANGDYEVQFVSPVGFFSESYNGANATSLNSYDNPITTAVDMISYARVLYDDGDINPGSTQGYTYFNKWRNSNPINGNLFSGVDGGNTTTQVTDIESKTDGQSTYYEIEFADDIYNYGGNTNGLGRGFNDSNTKDMQEPFYIINIIETGKTQVNQDIDTYLNTGTYVKLESLIGITTGADSFELVDERWEDCIPALDSGSPLAGNERFVYVVDDNGDEFAWMNVDYMTPAQITSIINDITSNGFYLSPIRNVKVYGVYNSTISQSQNTSQRNFVLNFNIVGSEINSNKRVYVKYDKESPVRIFGGDSTVGESLFAMYDRESLGDNTTKTKEDCFRLGIPFPYLQYEMNPGIYQISDSKPLNIQDWTAGTNNRFSSIAYIRQLIINFTCESRASLPYVYSGNTPLEYFPRTNYVMRPHKFDDTLFSGADRDAIYEDNNIALAYGDDYGDEYLRWKFGGFRFQPQYNNDYSAKNPIEFFSKKEFGFEEETKFCTRVIYSKPRAVNQQDSSGLRTFLSTNVFDINDNTGEIKKAYSEGTNKGNNLYAFTDSGICLLLTKKSILSDLNAGELAYMVGDQFIGDQYWIEHNVGMNDETWRTFGEGSISVQTQEGIVRREGIFWANNKSVYRLSENNVLDIGRKGYYSKLRPILKNIKPGFETYLTGYYDEKYDEYGFLTKNNIGGEIPIFDTNHFVFSQRDIAWVGSRDYNFDQFINKEDELYGMRDGEIHLMDSGYLINGVPIIFDMRQAVSPEFLMEKEFIRIQVNSDNKPTQINFYDPAGDLMLGIDEATNGPLYLKKYDGWEQFIGRKASFYDPDRKRIQSRVLGFGIQHDLEEDFKLISSLVQYKVIKGGK